MSSSLGCMSHYNAADFPGDLMLKNVGPRQFQARYAFGTLGPGTDDCAAATAYRQQIRVRYRRETHTLASLTVAYR